MTREDLTRDMIALAEQLEPVALRIEPFQRMNESQVRIRRSG